MPAHHSRWFYFGILSLICLPALDAHGQTGTGSSPENIDQAQLDAQTSSPDPIWHDNTVGSGFTKGSLYAAGTLGVGFGTRDFGGQQSHDLLAGTVHIARNMTGLLWKDHWWQGNLALGAEFMAAHQYDPGRAYVAGLTPLLRYTFATGTSVVPFLEGGAGVALTDIGEPDLDTKFEFSPQAGAGLHWFFRPNIAATVEYRFLHLSNAGIEQPNRGLNTSIIAGGITCFF